MNHPPLAIFGYSEAAMFLGGAPKPNVSAIISIHGGREFAIEAEGMNRLDLRFDDVEAAIPDDVSSIHTAMRRKRRAEQDGLVEVAPLSADAASIISFAEQVKGVDGFVLCHCGGGMSRAPAAALICLAVWRGSGSERECVEEILKLRCGAVPHAGLVRFADDLLGRNHRLLNALATIRQ